MKLFPALDQGVLQCLNELCLTLHQIHQHSAVNLMPASNLALMWAPNFLRSDDALVDLRMCAITSGSMGLVIKILIEECPHVFLKNIY